MNLTWIHKIGRIFVNNGPIFKIQILTYSVEQACSVLHSYDGARDDTLAMTSWLRIELGLMY